MARGAFWAFARTARVLLVVTVSENELSRWAVIQQDSGSPTEEITLSGRRNP